MKVAVIKCGRQTATMEVSANGLVSVTGKTAQKRSESFSIADIAELSMHDVMILRDRRDVNEPLPCHLQAIVNEIWEEIAEDEPWFSFCVPTYAEAE